MNNKRKTYILSFISFIVGTSQFVLMVILDKIAVALGIQLSTAGQLVSGFSLANAIGTPLIMGVIVKMNRRIQLLLSLLGLILGLVSIISFSKFSYLFISTLILGIGSGIFTVVAYSLAAELALPENKGEAISNISMGSSLALIFGVPLGRLITSIFGWKSIFIILVFLCLIAIFLVSKFIPSFESKTRTPLKNQKSLLKSPVIILTLFMTFLLFLGYSTMNIYVTLFLKTVLKFEEKSISLILSIIGITSLVGAKLGGKLADKIGIRKLMLSGIGFQIISLLLILIFIKLKVISLVFLVFWMVSSWAVGPMTNFNIISLETESPEVLLSLNTSFIQLGYAVGAGIGGLVIEKFGLSYLSLTGAVSVLLGLFIATKNIRLTNRKDSNKEIKFV